VEGVASRDASADAADNNKGKAAMQIRFRFILAALATFLPLSAVMAQQTGDPVAAAFAAADVDGDGLVDVDEYVGYFILVFRSVDADADGAVSPGDLEGVDPAAFARADRDGDGRASLEEAIAERMIIFFRADANRDGVLSLEEIRSYDPA
jgi:Ca2+-binding EF-hand superfamily protein